jgi:hypothetical protein
MKRYLAYCVVLIFFTYVCYEFWTAHTNISAQFKGIVQKVAYPSFGYSPTITVNNCQYDLEYIRWYDDGAKVEVGDSVVKEKGTQLMSLIKKNKK